MSLTPDEPQNKLPHLSKPSPAAPHFARQGTGPPSQCLSSIDRAEGQPGTYKPVTFIDKSMAWHPIPRISHKLPGQPGPHSLTPIRQTTELNWPMPKTFRGLLPRLTPVCRYKVDTAKWLMNASYSQYLVLATRVTTPFSRCDCFWSSKCEPKQRTQKISAGRPTLSRRHTSAVRVHHKFEG